jgi:hypothetical protein
MSTIMLPAASCTGRPTPIAAVDGGVLHRAFFDFRDAGGHRDDDARAALDTAIIADLVDEGLEHRFGDLEIGDDAILQRADGDDVAGRATEHPLGFIAHREDAFGAGFDGDDGRFAENNAAIANVNEGVGGAEIYTNIIRKKTRKNVHRK